VNKENKEKIENKEKLTIETTVNKEKIKKLGNIEIIKNTGSIENIRIPRRLWINSQRN
jgi:hypothetical protein